MHVLGYLIDLEEPGLRTLLRGFREERVNRAERMAAALRELGFELDQSLLDRRAAEGKSIGRPHLSQAVVSHPANASRLAAEGRTELSSFLEAYLIEGKPAFRERQGPAVAESIAAIHAAGGVAVWAHPFWDVSDPEEVRSTLDRFHADGLDGVECFYPNFTREQTELLADRCAELGLLSTGSSDFHGPGHRLFSEFLAFETYGREPRLGAIAA
jgi:3',5'-nucleoside bisphosphate phosphatase